MDTQYLNEKMLQAQSWTGQQIANNSCEVARRVAQSAALKQNFCFNTNEQADMSWLIEIFIDDLKVEQDFWALEWRVSQNHTPPIHD